jgi:hypothetical protein
VDKIRRHGVEILSYFIETSYFHDETKPSKDKENDPLRKDFRKMYGPTAKFINVENIMDLAKTMNELFLKKQT